MGTGLPNSWVLLVSGFRSVKKKKGLKWGKGTHIETTPPSRRKRRRELRLPPYSKNLQTTILCWRETLKKGSLIYLPTQTKPGRRRTVLRTCAQMKGGTRGVHPKSVPDQEKVPPV